MGGSRKSERETETALLICGDDPAGIARRIAGLAEIASYRLVRRPFIRLRDLYFDTPDGLLRKQHLAMRLRESDQVCLITLKGPSRPAAGGGMERLEIEAPWSQAALQRITGELVKRGVSVRTLRLDTMARPLRVMNSLGLRVVQGRETRRTVRDVVPAGQTKPQLAELAIDSVAYRFEYKRFKLHMIEVEAKSQDGLQALGAITRDLSKMFEPALRPWPYGKLATGLATEKLLRQGALKDLIDDDLHLSPAILGKLARSLKRTGAA